MKKKFLAGLGMLSVPFLLYAQENELSEFNPAFFSGTNIDIASLSLSDQMKPGSYDVELYENGTFIGTHTITLKKDEQGKTVIYFNKSILKELGFKEDINNHYLQMTGDEVVLDNNESGIKANFDVSNLSVDVVAPQLTLNLMPRGYVDPAYWEEGETAAVVNYTGNYYHSENKVGESQQSYNSFFSSVNTWFNAGAWQFRNYSTVTAGDRNKIDTLRTYVQRDIPKIYSVMRMGEVDAQQSILPVMSVLGVTLFSDPRMLPDSRRGYVPDIRGIANSNAKVTVRQSGHVIYETTVSPGQFLISDLYQASYGGDFEVTVQEADGSQKTFVVPYAYLPDLMRPNQSKYSVALGTLNDKSLRTKPAVSSVTYTRGLTNYVTGFTGAQLSKDYQSGLLGLALNTGIGAVSTSVAFASADLGYKESQGYNIGVAYSNVINDINTSISLATYHYSSSGFTSLQDAARAKDQYDHEQAVNDYDLRSVNMKNSAQLNINQPVSDSGNVYVSAAFNNYWSYSKSDSSYQAGYSNQFKNVSYTVSVARTHNPSSGNSETQYQISLSFPLGEAPFAPRMTTAYSQSSNNNGGYLSNSVYGTALKDRSLSYGLNTNVYTSGNQANNVGGNLSKNTAYGMRSANASYDKNTRQYSLSMNGAVALHAGGITFGQYTGDTVGIIYAEGGEGATISGNDNIRIDSRGYAIYPYLSPYRDNNISLDPNSASSELEIKNTSRHTAPLAGAIVKLKFDTITGEFRVFEVKYNGQNIPLGAVANSLGSMIGMTGGGGMLMIRENKNARIDMSWVDESNIVRKCYFNIKKIILNNKGDITKQPVDCI